MSAGKDATGFDDFRNNQDRNRNTLKKKLDQVHDDCEGIFLDGIRYIFNEVQKRINSQNNESNFASEDSKNKRNFKGFSSNKKNENKQDERMNTNASKKEDNVVNDDNIVGFESLPYKYKMMIKNECMNFIKLAFIFDFIMKDILRRMYLFSIEDTIHKLKEFNDEPIPSQLRENLLNKNEDYDKPQYTNNNRVIPYFLVTLNLSDTKIEQRDKIKQNIKPFYFKVLADDQFDPTAHIMLEPESNGENENEPAENPLDSDKEIVVDMIQRPSHYFTSFLPEEFQLRQEFKKQVNTSIEMLKIPGWRGHPVFAKYLTYLEDYDDRFSEWNSKEAQEIDPVTILKDDDLYDKMEDTINSAIIKGFDKC